MKNLLQPKHLPIPLALLLLLAGLGGGIFLINKTQYLPSQASSETAPQQVKITNTGDSSFVVSWVTSQKVTGLVAVGETKEPGELRKDFRDRNREESAKSAVHFVLVDNLKNQTKYYFKIISAGQSYDNSGKLFEVTTAAAKVPSDNDIAYGKILTREGQPASGALVYLSLANTTPQAAITDSNGNWMIPLSTARTLDLQNFSTYDRNAQIEEISVRGEEETASATLTTASDAPAPDITLGQNYNFLSEVPSPTPTPVFTAGQGGLPPASSSGQPPTNLELTITSPSEDEEINSPLPEFFGTGPNSQTLKVEIQSNQTIETQTSVDVKGQWSWSSQTPLSPGEHTITVSYTDQNGFLRKATRSFIVLAAEQSELPAFTATPSGQKASPTVKPSPTPTTKPKVSPTPTSVPVRTSLPSTESGAPPSTGIDFPTKIFFGTGLFTILIGAALIIL